MEIPLTNMNGRNLNCKVEVEDGLVRVHSRSGTGAKARNPDYRQAVLTILERLGDEGISPSVHLDSAPARKAQPDLQRREVVAKGQLTGNYVDQFNAVVRALNSGSASKGAWRQAVFLTPKMPAFAVATIIDGTARARNIGVAASDMRKVTRAHLLSAIEEARSGEPRFSRFSDATGYELVPPDGGEALPPKLVFGIALSDALQSYTTPQDFGGGETSTSFRVMRERGFSLQPISGALASPHRKRVSHKKAVDLANDIPPSDEDVGAIEGNPKVASHMRRERSGKLAKDKKASFEAKHGRLYCEKCGEDYIKAYGRALARACMEAHHRIPLGTLDRAKTTTLDDLMILCANCHRVEHRILARSN